MIVGCNSTLTVAALFTGTRPKSFLKIQKQYANQNDFHRLNFLESFKM